MKPLKILLFFTVVFGLLFLISLVFPKDGIGLGKQVRLQFISSADIFNKDTLVNTYTDSIILHAEVSDDPEFGEIDTLFLMPDSIVEVQVDVNMDSIIKAKIDSISKRVFPIQFGGSAKDDLYDFFSTAERSKKENQLVRILHYGDSQIENDRMSNLLRFRFQKIFGGSGCGLVPAIPLYFGNPTFKEEYDGDWTRYTGFGIRDSTLDHNCYGLLSCYTDIPVPKEDEFPSLNFRFVKGRKASRFSQLKLYLHSYSDSGSVSIQINDTITETLTNIQTGYRELSYKTDLTVENLKIAFNMDKGGRVYALGFDPEAGVQLDNIAMRGSSGLEFSKSDRHTLDTMIQNLNPGMIIMQFGGNVVPYITNCAFYKKAFKRELSYIRDLLPNIAVLVIGPADMSTRDNGKFVTYPTLEPVRNALKEAALESGCGFWDMYEAMGGGNSMQNFVLAEPPLATTDYIHFTQKGANMMAGMFFEAVMLEYSKYISEK